ncbi:DEAD/DEAH box helicase [Collimonas fungivorans]|uniref:Helicase, SNF2/RAD54 family n=1 Tax=Collimonas fungivorans (strain Ter331) TaxID=1005048 RepID=G0ADN2_COLFT|nr:DEAD/DEAH box helicase [Collimonas fungivorans]AEK63574.1 helicase, SNF2/RAD54 family [Collimonas fungivorans Ter331]
MNLTLADVRDVLHQATYDRGQEYVRQRRVLAVEQDGDVLNATVQGSGSNVYQQEITLSVFRDAPDIDSVCSCPVGSNCKHVAAALIEYLQRPSTDQLPIPAAKLAQPAAPMINPIKPAAGPKASPAPVQALARTMEAWLTRVEGEVSAAGSAPAQPSGLRQKAATHQVLFVLSAAYNGKKAVLHLCKAQQRPNGQSLSAQPVTDVPRLLSDPAVFLRPEDRDLIGLFVAQNDGNHAQHAACELSGKLGAQLLQALLQQQRLLWANSLADLAKGTAYPLQLAATRRASLAWYETVEDSRDVVRDMWQLGWQFEAEPGTEGRSSREGQKVGKHVDYLLPTEPPWYVDNLSCGELVLPQRDARISSKALNDLVIQAPLLDPDDRLAVAQQLLAQGLNDVIPFPPQVPQTIRKDIRPQPLLVLGSLPSVSNPLMQDFAELHFRYDGEIASTQFTPTLSRNTPAGIEQIVRDQDAENVFTQALLALGMLPLQDTQHPLAMMPGMFMQPDQSSWLRFAKEGLPQLASQGWLIDKRAEYRFDVVAVDDWYAEIDEAEGQPGNASFDLELGIVVNHQRVPLLPLLVDLIRHAPQDFDPRTMALRDDQDELLVRLSDGIHVAMPWGRIKPILNTLGELYFAEKSDGPVRLSALDAARLAELEAGAKLRWVGGDRLRSMGQKLHTFGGVKKIAAPAGLQATLRDYQLEGLAWMQFLREYDLAGILADDMGLGKTVQTLAHILVEKQSGRLTAPALVIAPTSLMDNWQQEALRFAPELRVLVLQGKQRLEQFDQVGQFDLVLTTYALLPRDEEHWRRHAFHLLILDEAHYIKNPRSKVAQSAALLNARHRLCLTGTPVENHLGELWAQFHFLLPGLLGDEKTFNRDFRQPIEKHSDATRRALLVRRIKPFLLRRTKDKVAKELPPKTEMLRSVTLSGAQRDLYENVRLVMDKKVREEVAKKGVARSHIVILEALLKLRQACCDPRLLKTDLPETQAEAGKEADEIPSAKLLELLEMVDELRQEDRRILVFSQFTSMLALIAAELRQRDIGYAMLTGATLDRAEAVRSFQDGEVPVFLISLKAGGVGLNLTAADTVIHYDPWWNPAAESQATDRAWRIGQDKPVFVYKLIAKGTVEESIQLLQQKKAGLAQAMLSPEGETQNIGLTQDDLQAIFAPLAAPLGE